VKYTPLTLAVALTATTALALTACDSGSSSTSTNEEVVTVVGSLESDRGNQHVTPAMLDVSATATVDMQADARSVTVATVQADGALVVIGEGDVDGYGNFSITELPAIDGPFVVEARDDDGEVIGRAIVPGDAEPGEPVIAQPISAETSVETDVMLRLLADGAADRETLDTVALMTRISAELAAETDASAETALADAVDAAETSYLGVIAGIEGEVDASAIAEARLHAWAELATDLDQATDSQDENDAWLRFDDRLNADVSTAVGVSLDVLASAEAAASTSFSETARAPLSVDAAAHARVNAAVRAAMADRAAQRAILDLTSDASLTADLDAAYADFMASVRAATDVDQVDDAVVEISAAVSGQGMEDASASILGRVIAENESDSEAQVAAQTAISAAAEAAAALDAALDSDADTEAIITAFVVFHEAVQTAVDVSLDGALSTDTAAFVANAAAQAGGHASAVLDVTILDGLVTGGVSVTGLVLELLSTEHGADGLVSSRSFAVLADVATSALLTADASGALNVVATGTVDTTSGEIAIGDVTEPTVGASFLAVLDGSSEVLGMVHLPGGVDGTEDVTADSITLETTTEAEVLLRLIADGHPADAIDTERVDARIDLAVSAAVESSAELAALAEALWVSQQVHASAAAEAAGDAYAEALVDAQASAAFEATVAELAGTGSLLFAAVDARAQLDNAFDLGATVTAAFDDAGFAGARGIALSAAVDDLVSATSDASTHAEILAAGDAFGETVTAVSGGAVLSALAESELELTAIQETELATAVEAAMTAGATFETQVQAAIDVTSGEDAGIDVAGAVDGVVTAGDELQASLEATLNLAALATVGPDEREAVELLIGQAAAGLYGSAGVD